MANIFDSTQKSQFNGRIEQQVIANGYSSTFGKLMAAQANYETGGYTNTAFTKYNNIGGYKYDKNSKHQLHTVGNVSTEGDPYASYATLEDSVDETIDWFRRREKDGFIKISEINTPKDYVNALLADPNHQWFSNGNNPPTQTMINDYIFGMSNLIQKIQFLYDKNKTSVGITIIGLSLFIYLYIKYYKK
jgi:hypothetical protein